LFVAIAFHQQGRQLLAYRVKKEFDVLFMLKELSPSGRYISSGDDIFKEYYPDYQGIVDDISIKQDLKLRNKMIKILQSQDLHGWLNSLENKRELEIFIFGNENLLKDLFEPISIKGQEFEYYDALKYIVIKPSNIFLSKSISNFHKNYMKYANDMRSWWKDLISNDGYTKEQATYELFDLRLKLKI
jgi:hypothetical protein